MALAADDDARADELDALLAVYCGERELIVHERSADLFHFEVHLSIDVPGRSISLCVLISLPPRYPAAEHAPIVQLRGDSISGTALRSLHAALVQFMQLECDGQASCFLMLDWIREHAGAHMQVPREKERAPEPPEEIIFVREYFHFHHLYSAWKRKLILQWARDLDLTGFVFPGKPGTACVEGTAAAVREFGASLRSLQWQKLGSRHIDRVPQLRDAAALEALRRFARPMVELGGEATAVGGSLHADQGYLLKVLTERGLEAAFTSLTGFET